MAMTRLINKDGSISYGFRNPDGSWVEIPAPEGQPSRWVVPMTQAQVEPTASGPDSIRQFLREIGQRGGKARAARHGRAEISAWGGIRRKGSAGT